MATRIQRRYLVLQRSRHGVAGLALLAGSAWAQQPVVPSSPDTAPAGQPAEILKKAPAASASTGAGPDLQAHPSPAAAANAQRAARSGDVPGPSGMAAPAAADVRPDAAAGGAAARPQRPATSQ
jgi:hypothetical protein